MTVVPSQVSPLHSEIVSRHASMSLRTCARLLARCALSAALLVGLGAMAVGQAAHFSGAQVYVDGGGANILSIAADGKGDVFFTSQNGSGPGSQLLARFANSNTGYLLSGFNAPSGLAVDASGNLFVLDSGTGTIDEILAVNGSIPATVSPTIVTVANGITSSGDLAVDTHGNLYFTSVANNAVEEILAVNGVIPPSPTVRNLGSGFSFPIGIAVDSLGNVYVGDFLHSTVKEMVAVNGSIPASPVILTLGSGFSEPAGLALDSVGNLYVSDYGNNALKEILAVDGVIPSSPAIKKLGTYSGTQAVTLDPSGNIYIGDTGNNSGGSVFKVSVAGANFASTNVGSTHPVISMVFTFDTAGVLGGASVLTQGATGLDFNDAGSGTCAPNTAYTAGQTCTLNVSFTPKFAGTRYGAAVLKDTSDNVIATGYVQGTGVGPQLNFLPGIQSTILVAGLSYTGQVAVDGSGSLYITDWTNNRVLKETQAAGTYAQSILGSGFNTPLGIAVDGAGIVYIADTYNNRLVIETPSAGGYLQSVAGSGLNLPMRVAVDGSGNIYIADYGNQRVVKETLSANGYVQSVVASSGLNGPSGVAVDGSGNVYIADVFNNQVLKETVSATGYIESAVGSSSLNNPNGVAVDGNGNIYISDSGHDRVVKEFPSAGGYIESTIASVLNGPADVALDGGGNVYISETTGKLISKIDFVDPPSLVFAPTSVGSFSTDSPQNVGLANIGNAAMIFPIPSTGNNPSIAANFTLNSSGDAVCPMVGSGSSQPGTLAAGASCKLPISFAPTATGAISGSLVLTDNNLNAAAPGYAAQSIALSGTGMQATPVISWHAPAPIMYGTALSTVQLNATANVPGTFSYNPAAGTIPPAGTDTLTVTFTPTDTTTYTTATASVTLDVHVTAPTINWPTPTPITYGTSLSAAQLNASSPVSGTFLYTPSAGTVLSPGQQTLTVKFTPTDSVNYTTAFGSVVLTLNKATPVITWATPAPVTYGTLLGPSQLNASANVPGTFAYNPAAGTVLPTGTNALTTTFTPTDTQNYATTAASVLLTVTPSFMLSASSSLAIVQNNSVTTTISVIPYGGFTDAVHLSISGLPSGVTASFGTNPTTSTSVLTFKVGPKATVGTSNVTVSGTSANLTRTTVIVLTIVSRK